MIPSGQSKRFYELLASSVSSSGKPRSVTRASRVFDESERFLIMFICAAKRGRVADEMDAFYRLFMVPGMGHCVGGPGAWKLGQGAIQGRGTDGVNHTDHSVMLSIVDWVEGGNPPSVIVGTDDNGVERKHCMWPSAQTVWSGGEWVCEPVGSL
jgi:hypothetical protein